LAAVRKKLAEVEADRNNNHQEIINHHQGKIHELGKEKEKLSKKHKALTALHEETTQQQLISELDNIKKSLDERKNMIGNLEAEKEKLNN